MDRKRIHFVISIILLGIVAGGVFYYLPQPNRPVVTTTSGRKEKAIDVAGVYGSILQTGKDFVKAQTELAAKPKLVQETAPSKTAATPPSPATAPVAQIAAQPAPEAVSPTVSYTGRAYNEEKMLAKIKVGNNSSFNQVGDIVNYQFRLIAIQQNFITLESLQTGEKFNVSK